MRQPKLAALVLSSVLALACGSEVSRDRTPEYHAPVEIRQQKPKAQPNPPAVTFLIDKTDSEADDILKDRIEEIKTFLRGLRPAKVSVVSFGADGRSTWYAPDLTIVLPTLETATFDEAVARERLEKQCNLRKRCIDAEIAKERSRAQANFKEGEATYNTRLDESVEEIANVILKRPTAEPSCSDFNEVGERIGASKSDIIILISDGQHNCGTPLKSFNFSGRHVLVLLLPLKNSVSDRGFAGRLKAIRTAFAGANVIPLVSADAQDIAGSVTADQTTGG